MSNLFRKIHFTGIISSVCQMSVHFISYISSLFTATLRKYISLEILVASISAVRSEAQLSNTSCFQYPSVRLRFPYTRPTRLFELLVVSFATVAVAYTCYSGHKSSNFSGHILFYMYILATFTVLYNFTMLTL